MTTKMLIEVVFTQMRLGLHHCPQMCVVCSRVYEGVSHGHAQVACMHTQVHIRASMHGYVCDRFFQELDLVLSIRQLFLELVDEVLL